MAHINVYDDDDLQVLMFKMHLWELRDPQKEKYLKKLISLKTNVAKFNFVYNDLVKRKSLENIGNSGRKKNDDSAIYFRESGNKKFGLGNYFEALEDYTRSIALAANHVIVALAYANRSACLYKLDMYNDCLTDIERALNNNYPDKLKPKLIKRRESSQRLLKPPESAHEEVPEIMDTARNLKFACASNCIKIETRELYDNFAVATRNIEPGELICVESGSVCVLKENEKLVHCHECLKFCCSLIPCDKCTQALFCNESCKEKAGVYHKYECQLNTQLELDNTPLQLAVKTAILAKENRSLLKEFQLTDRKVKGQCECLFVDDDTMISNILLLAKCFHVLKTSTNFFENRQSKDNFKNVTMSYLQLWTLSLEIHEYAAKRISYERNHFADGIYPVSSLLYENCYDPNLEKAFYGSKIVIRALVPIKKGQRCVFSDDLFPNTSRHCSIMTYYCLHKEQLLQFEDLDSVLTKLLRADVDFAKELLPQLINEMKSPFLFLLMGTIKNLREMIGHCYDTLGNKRRV